MEEGPGSVDPPHKVRPSPRGAKPVGPWDDQIARGTVLMDQGVLVHFDGACEPPRGGGIATWAFTVEGEGLDSEESGLAAAPGAPHATNNVAEYVAAIRALEYLAQKGYRGSVTLLGDSQLVIRQFTGEYAVRTPHLRSYHERLHQLGQRFEKVQFFWIPRHQNARADWLTKQAIRRVLRQGENGPPSPVGREPFPGGTPGP